MSLTDDAIYKRLVERYKNDALTPEEKDVFFHLLGMGTLNNYMDAAMEEEAAQQTAPRSSERSGVKIMAPRWWRWAAAAVIIALAAGVYLRLVADKEHVPSAGQPPLVQVPVKDLLPGGNRATLTLADNTVISLDHAEDGIVAVEGATNIVKTADGKLAYNTTGMHDDKVVFNTLHTPVAGQYRITLPDGTMVCLNASSSLYYPNRFEGKERRVKLTGEGYFEVKHDDRHPFIVAVNDIEVHDLGTAFNINAYPQEDAVRTTLVSGLAGVQHRGQTIILKPGKVAVTSSSGTVVQQADVALLTAWKNGDFLFKDTDIKTIMRQVERWYGAEVEFKGNVPYRFNGRISRSEKVSELLKLLALTGKVRFTIEGNKITVIP